MAGAEEDRPIRASESSPHAPRRAAGAVFERDAELREPFADQVGLVEQRLLERVVLRGPLRLGAHVVPQVEEQLHETGDESIAAAERLLRGRLPEETEDTPHAS